MDNFEIVEKLVEKTGVSYSEAKEALEVSDWDLLDAVIYLENAGKTEKKSSKYSTSETKVGTEENSQTGNIQEDFQKPESDNMKYYYQKETAKAKSKFKQFLHSARLFLFNNKLLARNNDGKEVFTIPVVIALILLLATFWISIILFIISLFKGYQYSFTGPDLGKESVNKAAESVENLVIDIGNEFKAKREAKKEENKGHSNNDYKYTESK